MGFGIKWSRGDRGRSGSAGKTIHCARSARWTWSNIRGPGNHRLKGWSSNGGGGGGGDLSRLAAIVHLARRANTNANDARRRRRASVRRAVRRHGGRRWVFFVFFLHGEHCTGAFRSARTKGTWGPLSNRCVRSAEKRRRRALSNHFSTVWVSASERQCKCER